MNAAMQASLDDLAHKIRLHIAHLAGEDTTFEEKNDDWVARIQYEATVGEDKGDRRTAPSWWIDREKATVVYVSDRHSDNDNDEAADYLTKILN